MTKECKDLINNTNFNDCLDILGEIDESSSMEQIKQAVTKIEEALPYLESIPRNENGEIDSRGVLALSSNINEYEFLSDITNLSEKANNILDENDNLEVQNALIALSSLHFSGDKEEIDSYIELIKGTLEENVDKDLELQINEQLDDLKEFAKSDVLDDENDAFKEMQKQIEEEYRKTLEENIRIAIEEEQTKEAEAAMERSNKFHEVLNEFEERIKEGILNTLEDIKDITLGKEVDDKDNNNDVGFEL